jgi:YVTN family beta-propeller protein
MIRRRSLHILAAAAALACCGAGALQAGPALAAARTGPPTPVAARIGASGAPDAALGPNLLLNPGAQAGAPSARGWDAVTIPGWTVTSGLPTVVRYGTAGFPRATGAGPAVRGGQLFAGGAGGTARLQQVIRLRTAGGRRVPAGTGFRLSAWLGGDRRSRASVTAAFLSAAGKVVGHAETGPVGGPGAGPPARRSAAGVVPSSAATVRVTLVLATSVKDIDGPDAPLVGYDWATADDLAFRVSAPVRRRVLTAPAADMPRYQHVFLFYFENEDYRSVIGNTRQAPFFNSLLPHASVLSDFFAEEHPSDGNYLALAGGSTFGVPLDDPLEEDPKYTIRARDISDLIGAAHETWKAYLQSADGPCDDTVHGYYWDDDMPMTYFADVRDRPAFCASHLVPLQALQTDLTRTASTPNFAWVSPDDCSDIEGCGIKAGDSFLAAELGAIMRSPAWRTQRSLAIITFDEDGYDHQHPAQRVPTIILGSAGVRQGYVSHVRYTHYSLLRTIEAALGLGTLTANDRYAQPVNDVFVHGAAAAALAADAAPAVPAAGTAPAVAGGVAPAAGSAVPAAAGAPPAPGALADADTADAGGGPAHQTAFVANAASDSVTPVDLVTHRAGKAIEVGKDPQAIAISPSGSTAYVVNSGSGTVTPISTVSRKAGRPIRVGNDPQDIAIAPDGRAAYVTNLGSDSVTPVNLATGQAGPPIPVGAMPRAIAITPDGRTAFVLDWGGAAVTPIRLPAGRIASGTPRRPASLGRAGRAIPVGGYPFAVSIAPDGSTAYVASYGSSTVTPISVASLRAGRLVPAGQATNSVAVAPDSATVYAVGGDSDTVTPIAATRGSDVAGRDIPVGYSPTAVAFSASGQTAFVVNAISGTVTPVSTATGRKGRAIRIGAYSYPTAIVLAPAGPTAVVVSPYAGQVTLINTARRRPVATVTVGSFPTAAAIAP